MMENYIDMLELKNDELKDVLMDMQEESNVHLKENKRLKSGNKEMYNTMNDELNELHMDFKEIKKENKHLEHNEKLLYNELNELKKENKELQDDVNVVVNELKEENKRLTKENNTLFDGDVLNEEIKELKAENDKLKHELKHKAIKLNQSHYPKEYQAEADEWFEHNPQDEKLFFFMVGGSGVDEDGDVINTLNVGADAIAECDNYKGVISVETYK